MVNFQNPNNIVSPSNPTSPLISEPNDFSDISTFPVEDEEDTGFNIFFDSIQELSVQEQDIPVLIEQPNNQQQVIPISNVFETNIEITSNNEVQSTQEKILEVTRLTSDISEDSVLKQALNEYIDAFNLLQSDEANLSSKFFDEQLITLRNNYFIFSEQLEQYGFDEQTEERLSNLMFELTFDISDVFGRNIETVLETPQINGTSTPNPQGAIDIINDDTKTVLEKISELQELTSSINQDAALQQSISAYINALIALQSQEALNQQSNEATQNQAILDEQTLALRNNYLIFSQQLEQYALDEQTKEKVKNLMFELTFNMTDNLFKLAKTVVGSAKY